MYVTSTKPTRIVAPYWNEIKKLSHEDRSNLAELIERSLTEEETANQEVETFLAGLDENLMRKAAEYAHRQFVEGKCVPHAEVMERIKESMGWK